ncbi:MAG: hypothetical protein ABFR89_07815, partial [Actinomycetota bacterium]
EVTMRLGGTLLGFTTGGAMLIVAIAWPALTAPAAEPPAFTVQSMSSDVDVGDAATEPLFDLSAAGGDPAEVCIRLIVAAEPGDNMRLYSAGVSYSEAADRIGIRITRTDPVEYAGQSAGVIPCNEMGNPTTALTRLSLSLAEYAETRFAHSIGDSLGIDAGGDVFVDLKIMLTLPSSPAGLADLETGWLVDVK